MVKKTTIFVFLTVKSEIFSYISRKNTRTRNLSVLLGKLSISGRERRRGGVVGEGSERGCMDVVNQWVTMYVALFELLVWPRRVI